MFVRIDRGAWSTIQGVVAVEEITGIKWDDIGGGVGNPQKGYSLYGYINYNLAAESVNCSGEHEYFGNGAKIRILSKKKNSPYYAGYKYLCDLAGGRKSAYYGKHTAKSMLALLKENGQMEREKLREALAEIGCSLYAFSKNVRRLKEAGKIKCTGPENSPYQKIELVEEPEEK